MSEIKLKPCPFCGSDDVQINKGAMWGHAVHCNHCGADVIFWGLLHCDNPNYDYSDELASNWNRRVPYTIADGILKDIPSADVVEVVRCKDCAYFHTTASGVSYCTNQDMMPFADDYCCNAKRKDESK